MGRDSPVNRPVFKIRNIHRNDLGTASTLSSMRNFWCVITLVCDFDIEEFRLNVTHAAHWKHIRHSRTLVIFWRFHKNLLNRMIFTLRPKAGEQLKIFNVDLLRQPGSVHQCCRSGASNLKYPVCECSKSVHTKISRPSYWNHSFDFIWNHRSCACRTWYVKWCCLRYLTFDNWCAAVLMQNMGVGNCTVRVIVPCYHKHTLLRVFSFGKWIFFWLGCVCSSHNDSSCPR